MRDQARASIPPIESARVAEVMDMDGVHRADRGGRTMLKFLVFAVSPMVLLATSAAAGLVLLFLLARLVGIVDHGGAQLSSFGRGALPYVLPALTIVIPAAVLTAAYYVLARYLGIGRGWTLVSCLVLSVLAGLAICDVHLSDMPGHNQLTLGLGFGTGQLWRLSQALAPLALGLWLFRRGRDTGREPASRETTRLAA